MAPEYCSQWRSTGPWDLELAEIGGPAVVLVDHDRIVGHHHECGVTTRPVGDRRLDVDRDLQPGRDLGLDRVGRPDELGETERGQCALLLARREPGQQDRDVPTEVLGEPGLVVVIAVQVGDVEEVGVLDPVAQVVGQLIVAREGEPRAEERRLEPRIAQDRSGLRLDQHSRVSDGGHIHAIRLRPGADPDAEHGGENEEQEPLDGCGSRRRSGGRRIRRRAGRCTAGRRG